MERGEQGGGMGMDELGGKRIESWLSPPTRCLPTAKRGDQNLALVYVHARADGNTLVSV